MDPYCGSQDQFELLHALINNYKLNGETEPERNSDSENELQEDIDFSYNPCETELEAHVLRKKIKHLNCDYSSEEDDFDEESVIFGHPSTKATEEIQPIQKNQKEQLDIILSAMDLNSKMRDATLVFEQNLVQILHDIMSRKQTMKQHNCVYRVVDKRSDEDILNAHRGFLRRCGVPYFKDKDGFPCPINKDTRKKIWGNQLMVSSLFHQSWRADEMKVLEIGIKNCLIDEYKDSYERRTGKKVTDKNNEFEKYSKHVKSNDLSLLLQAEPDRNFDWMKIAVSMFGNNHSSTECEKIWNLYLKPTINKHKWAKEETDALTVIAMKYGKQNWDQIARELNTSRTGYQCFIHYQTNNEGVLCLGPWSKYEDKRLSNIINMSMYGRIIIWSRVCYYMEDRAFAQIYARWQNSLDPELRKGKFSRQEDSRILEGIYQHGQKCKDIARTLGNRNPSQIRERFEHRLKSLLHNKVGEWTLEEDKLLLSLVQEFGDQKSRWAEIAKRFKTRNRTQVRQRYNNLKKKMNENPHFRLDKIRRAKKPNEKQQIRKRNKLLANIALTLSKSRRIKAKCKVKLPKNINKIIAGLKSNPQNDKFNNIFNVRPVLRRYGRRVKNSKIAKENIIKSEPETQDELATLENEH